MDIKEMLELYDMGTMGNHEFVCRYMAMLSALGAEKPLYDKVEETLQPLVSYLQDILNGAPQHIEDYNATINTNICKYDTAE